MGNQETARVLIADAADGNADLREASPRGQKYRAEIDGLRAVAVIAVILNHFDKSLLATGYLGVDIFFVISGFVITSSVYDRSRGTLLQVWSEFYGRRFKRLFPALAVCVLTTSILISLVDPQPVASLRTGLTSLFGLSNLYLLKQATDYFGTGAQLNAFTHTWSLGVEEQFYLLLPLAIWATGFGRGSTRTAKPFVMVVGAASAISLIFYVVVSARSQPLAFFLLPSRLWELGLGILLYPATAPGALSARLARKIPPSLPLIALVGVLMVRTEAQVPVTIAVAGLTAVLIASLRPRTGAYRLLTQRPMSYLGRISYSLYLWHWSVICLSRWTVGLSWQLAPVLFGLMLALAAASYHGLESPLRRARWSRSWLTSSAYGLAAVGVAVAAMVLLIGSIRPDQGALFTGARAEPAVAANQREVVSPKGTLLVVGDSHAGHFTKLAKDVAGRFGLRPTVITLGAMPFPAVRISTATGGLTREKNLRGLADAERQVDQALAGFKPDGTNLIVLSSFYRFYFETPLGDRKNQVMSHYDASGQPISVEKSLELWLESLRAFAARHRNIDIVVVLSTPEMPGIYSLALCKKEWFRPHPSDKCQTEVDRKQTVDMLARLNSRIVQGVASSPNVSTFDPMPAVCPEGQNVCRSHEGGVRLFVDEDHLTEPGSDRVEAAFLDHLAKVGFPRDANRPTQR